MNCCSWLIDKHIKEPAQHLLRGFFVYRCSVDSLLGVLCLFGKLGFQPARDVPEGIEPPELVEHFVAGILIENDFDVFQSGTTVHIDDTAHALPIFADRILIAGQEQQRQLARGTAEGMGGIGLGKQRV